MPADLKVRLTLADRLSKRMTGASAVVKKFVGVIKTAALSATGLGAALGAITAGKFVTDFLEQADAIGKLSARLGLSTDFLQEFADVSGKAGVESNVLNMALQRVQRRFGEIAITGRGTALKALEELGGGLLEAVKQGADFEELLPRIADQFAKIEDSTKKATLAQKLFDSEGVKLVNVLQQGSRAIEDQRKAFRDLGGVIDETAIKNAEAFNDAVQDLKTVLIGFRNQAITPLLVPLKDLVNAFIELSGGIVQKPADAVIKFSEDTKVLNERLDELNRQIKALQDAPRGPAVGGFGFPITTRDTIARLTAERDAVKSQLDRVVRERGQTLVGPPDLRGLTTGPLRSQTFERVSPDIGEPPGAEAEAIRERSKALEELIKKIQLTEEETETLGSTTAGVAAGFAELQVRFSAFNVAREAISSIGSALHDQISNNLSAIIEGTKSAKEAFTDMAKGILNDLQRIIVRALIARALGALIGAPGGGPGIVGAIASAQHGLFVPPGQVQPAVLHGGRRGEVVLPLDRLGGRDLSADRGTTVIYNIEAIDVEDFDKKIGASIQRQDRTVAALVANRTRQSQQLRTAFAL